VSPKFLRMTVAAAAVLTMVGAAPATADRPAGPGVSRGDDFTVVGTEVRRATARNTRSPPTSWRRGWAPTSSSPTW